MRTKSKNGAVAQNVPLRPVADTVSGSRAAESPDVTLAHYKSLAGGLWLPPALAKFADAHLENVAAGRTAWGSVSAPFGFGKTAASICMWRHASCAGFLAIPPLSCTSFEELAVGAAALAEVQIPVLKNAIRKLVSELSCGDVERMVRADSDHYGLPQPALRRMLRDKAETGRLAFDGSSHRFVDFLSRLSELAGRESKGLVIFVDELQQLLGPLDARTINRFREFVWGMRTERSRCGVVLALDTLLEARLERWAEDILHRIRETGPTFRLAEVYTREFPSWLWGKLTASNGSVHAPLNQRAIADDVLLALGQLVERADLANGPRTVIDVFQRAAQLFAATRTSYELTDFVDDIHAGRFRYLGEGSPIQALLVRLLADEWIAGNAALRGVVRTLAAFPLGCPREVLRRALPEPLDLDAALDKLFAPLLVKLSAGPALEALQRVRRPVTDWERILEQCWERLPALDVLAAHAPDLLLRTLVPRLFPRGNPADPQWELVSDEAAAAITGWRRYRGSFDPAFPLREVALFLGDSVPPCWPEDADVAVALLCEKSTDGSAQPSAELCGERRRVVLRLPVLRPIDRTVPAELERHRKFIEPEPFRAVMILAALHDLRSLADLDQEWHVAVVDGAGAVGLRQLAAFVATASDFLVRELLEGSVEVGLRRPIRLRGPELLRALFSTACHHIFPDYQTLMSAPKWRELLALYRAALRAPQLSTAQRQGRDKIHQPKAELYQALFRQSSTAAGDSLVRALGPLAQSSGDARAFSLRLAQHPGEVALLQYLRKLPHGKALSARAAEEFLRHRGYTTEEASELIDLLAAREAIAVDRQRNLTLLHDDASSREWLDQRAAALRRELLAMGAEPPSAASEPTSAELRNEITTLEERREQRIAELSGEAQTGADELAALIGRVVSMDISETWAETDLSMHLRGVATLLARSKDDLARGLRKELQRTRAEADKLSRRTTDSAAAWHARRVTFFAGWEKLRGRTAQFCERAEALATWLAPNEQLQAARALCAKVRATDPGPGRVLEALVSEFRERFAVDQWAPVFASAEFGQHLRDVQADVQVLLFRHAQAFYHERGVLLRDLARLLPRDAPEFEIQAANGNTFAAVEQAFQRIYCWACEHFRTALETCRDRHARKTPWRDPRDRLSWKKINVKAEELLRATNYKTVLEAGAILERIRSGFRPKRPGPARYDNPAQPPDFEEIAELFTKGKIVIQVEPPEK